MTAPGRIVCATDFTARSDLALSRAVLLARQTGARLTLVHAVDPRQSQRQVRAQVNRAYVQLLSKVDQGFGSKSAAIDVARSEPVARSMSSPRSPGNERRPGGAGGAAAAATRLDRRHDGRATVARDRAPGARRPSRGARQLSTGRDGGGPFEHVAADDPDGVAARRSRRCRDHAAACDQCTPRRHAQDRRRGRASDRGLPAAAGKTTRDCACKRCSPLPSWKSSARGSWSGRSAGARNSAGAGAGAAGVADDRCKSLGADQAAADRQRHRQPAAHGDVRRARDSAADSPAACRGRRDRSAIARHAERELAKIVSKSASGESASGVVQTTLTSQLPPFRHRERRHAHAVAASRSSAVARSCSRLMSFTSAPARRGPRTGRAPESCRVEASLYGLTYGTISSGSPKRPRDMRLRIAHRRAHEHDRFRRATVALESVRVHRRAYACVAPAPASIPPSRDMH